MRGEGPGLEAGLAEVGETKEETKRKRKKETKKKNGFVFRLLVFFNNELA
jgi:hypothetical protein